MKTVYVIALVLAGALPASAQLLRPQAVNGAVIGGMAGAVIGNNSGDLHHNAWRGAAFGAGAGLLLGSLAADAQERRTASQVPIPDYPRTYVYREGPAYDNGSYDPADAPWGVRPNYAGTGLLLGALAGAVVGNNSGDLRHNAWRGAALGGAAGLLLGSVAEQQARRREAAAAAAILAPPAVAQPTGSSSVPTPPDTAAAAPAKTSAMTPANNLFGRP